MADGNDKNIAAFIVALLEAKGVGPRTVAALLEGEMSRISAAGALDAGFLEARAAGGSKAASRIARSLERSGARWEDLEAAAGEVLAQADAAGAHVLHPGMDAYPRRLLRNRSRPPVLYCLGDPGALDAEKAVAMVGTRNPTDFGARMGRRLAELLASDDYVIVSGLALGCDTMAHEGALDARGRTVAVLPTPIGAPVYPRQNQSLAGRIVDAGGALVSEYPPNQELTDRQLIANLVARDEWQPGLADGLVAFETSVDGGTRHAMRHALETGTPVAVFDYSARQGVDFWGDERFGGNAACLRSGEASRIFEPQTIDDFKARMDGRRASPAGGQQALPLG